MKNWINKTVLIPFRINDCKVKIIRKTILANDKFGYLGRCGDYVFYLDYDGTKPYLAGLCNVAISVKASENPKFDLVINKKRLKEFKRLNKIK